jgi:WD40 repeat protein
LENNIERKEKKNMLTTKQNTFTLYLIVISLVIHLNGIADKSFGQPILTINFPNDTNTPSKVAISPDGKRILMGLHTAKIWDAEAGREILHYTKTMNVIASAVFSPDGRHIFTGESGFRGQYWDMVTGELIFTIKTFTVTKNPRTVYYIHGITACDFTSDGSRLITGDSDGEVQLWDMSTGLEVKRYEPGGYIRYIKISPDGDTFLMQDAARALIVNMERGNAIREFSSDSCKISEDWKYILTRTGKIYDVNTGEVIRLIPAFHPSRVIAISPDGKSAIFGGYQDSYTKEVFNRRIFNNETEAEIRSYPTSIIVEKNAPNSPDDHILFFPDGKRFLTVNGTNVHIWDISDLAAGVKAFDSLDQ